jgi:hypothetical protein
VREGDRTGALRAEVWAAGCQRPPRPGFNS